MDSEIVYLLSGIIVFVVMAFFALRSDKSGQVQSKEEKRQEILDGYRAQLEELLEDFQYDKDARVAIKSQLLKKFSEELSLNIFFDKSEIRKIILELSLI